MVLLSYFWMFLPSSTSQLGSFCYLLIFAQSLFLPSKTVHGAISMFLLPSSFLLFFGCLLFLLIVAVVSLVDLQKGAWSN